MNGRNRLKKPIATAVVALLSFAVCACALQSEPLPSPPPTVLPTMQPSPTAVPVAALDPAGCELYLWHSFTGQKEATLLDLVAKFQTDNPHGIRLHVEFHNPLHQEALTAISAGTPPDVIITSCDRIAEYAALGAIVPLASYLDNTKYGFEETEHADLWPIVLSGCSSASSRGPWGLLFDLQAAVMFYNTDWLEDLNVEAPPQNWVEFRKLSNAARDKKAATWGYAHVNDALTLLNWISAMGGVLFDAQNSQATLDDAQAAAALAMLEDLLQEDCAYCASGPGADRAAFAAQELLFTFGSTADLPEYAKAIYDTKTEKVKFAWDIAPLPHLTSAPIVNVQGSVISILHTTPRQQLAAWLFLKWFVHPENDVQWALETGALPVCRSSAEVAEMQANLEQNPHYATACGMLAFATAEPAVPRWQDIRTLLLNAAGMVCLGQADPADALAAADTAADSLLGR